METLKSENKKRVLPSWMTDSVNETKVVSVKTAKRKQTAAVRVGAATRWDSLRSGDFSWPVRVGRAVRWVLPAVP